MKLTEIVIGKTLLIGVIISAALVLYGGVNYLIADGTNLLQATPISVRAERFTLHGLIVGLRAQDPLSYILLGVIMLFIVQLIRVAMAALIFYFDKEYILLALSSFVFIALLGSVLLNI